MKYFTTERILIFILTIVVIAMWHMMVFNKTKVIDIENHTITKHLKDSSHYIEQQVDILNSKRKISELEDSLQKAMSDNSNVTAHALIKYKEKLIYAGIDAKYLDTIDTYLLTVIAQQKTIDSIKHVANSIDYSRLVSVPKKFSFDKQWITGSGTIYKDKTIIDSIIVRSEPTIVFGQKHGIVTALIGNKNPYATQSNVITYDYKPKKSRFSLVAGPSYVFDGKSVKLGVGITAGFRIF